MMAPRFTTTMFAALTLAGALPAAAQADNRARQSFKASFETQFRTEFTKDCLQSTKESAAGRIREELLVSYCECSLNGMLKELTSIDVLKVYLTGKARPATEARVDSVVETCAQQTLSDRPASR